MSSSWRKQFILLGLPLVTLYCFWLAWPITLLTADIGRHIADGRIFFTHPEWRHALLHTNFYSNASPDYEIINHHWASGLVFAAVQAVVGWEGLHIFAITLCVCALLLFVRTAAKLSTPVIATAVAILLLPMIAYRLEVRPEFFGYLFGGGITYILHRVTKEGASARLLYILPLICVLWVNMHASFPVGVAVIVLYTIDAFLRKDQRRTTLLAVLILSGFALLLNPFGVRGALYPLSILRDPGYAVVENQSIRFLSSVGISAPAFLYMQITSVLAVLCITILVPLQRLKTIWPIAVMVALTSLMSWLAVRHITFAALFMVPFFAYAFHRLTSTFSAKVIRRAGVVVLGVCIAWQGMTLKNRWLVIGLEPNVNAAAEFLKEHNIQGPVFNNFDIGGYMIYHFFPDIRPYVYNRPESHPSDFWRDEYIPSMQDTTQWYAVLGTQKFNAIVLYHGDRTMWAQKFLVDRIQDSQWAPVFVDANVIIFLRQNGINAELIREFGIPPQSLLSS